MARKKYVDSLVLVNIKKHANFEAKFSGNHFFLVGPNGAGKTSAFQAIRRSLASLPEKERPEVWISKGKQDAKIKTVLVDNGEEYYVEESFSTSPGARSRIKLFQIVNGRKAELKPAQDTLTKVFGNMVDFSPLMNMTGEAQFEYIKKHFDLPIEGYTLQRKNYSDDLSQTNDLIDIENSMLLHTDNRIADCDREEYRQEKNVEQILSKKKDLAPLNAALELSKKSNQGREKLIETIQHAEENAQQKQDEIDELVRKIQSLQAQKQDYLEEAAEKRIQLSGWKEIDLSVQLSAIKEAEEENKKIDLELKTVVEHNIMVAKVKRVEESEKKIKELKTKSEQLKQNIKDLDIKLKTSLTELNFEEIFPGLALVYELGPNNKPIKSGLELNGLPFNENQQSLGELTKCVIKLSMFLNPDGLNFIWIPKWDLLDGKNKQDLIDFANEHENVQLGIEKVSDTTELVLEIIQEN